MTMPNERTNERTSARALRCAALRCAALRWAGEFIKELINAGELSEKRKHEARVILRHNPSATEIDFQFSGYFQIS